ncbi:Mif2/CENP-C like-domain-containing protein [Lasiosphaeria hispida]|uniref:CENP-C homolog n=1 Tax=Lasiosphaeria hispida TaxID=260671 RepID=A0AAJ0HA11_9PEZI|nr:Mif2/CENP-C like-domain-containing protein [Lasiosphaeria hispida]
MAPRSSQQRRTIAPQSEHIPELGVTGRKTGITLKDTGIRDEYGMEPLDALFSSPHKPDTDATESEEDEESDEDSSGEPMELTTNLGALINGHGNRLNLPLPRAKSPVKTTLNSPPQRNRHLARSSSPIQGTVVRERQPKSSSQPSRDQSSTKRRLDFTSVTLGGPHSLSQLVGRKLGALNGATRLANGYQHQDDSDEEEEEERLDENEEQEDNEEVNLFIEESMAMLTADTELSFQQENQDEAEEEIAPVPAAKKKPGRKPTSPPRTKLAKNRRIVEEEEEEAEDAAQSEAEEDEANGHESDESDEAILRPKKNAAKAAPPPKIKKAAASPAEPRPRKRRSLNTEDAADEDAAPERQTKRQRTETIAAPEVKKARGPLKKAADGAELAGASKPASKLAPEEKGKKGRKRKSSILPGDTSQVIVPRGPPLPKSRGLLINRREVPGESGSAMIRTRSGRNSFKPLAYWRNEHVDYDPEEAVTDAFGTKSHPSKFLLPSIKEIVRVDEPEHKFAKPSRKASSKRPGGSKSAGRRPKNRGYESSEDEDNTPADPWERDPGTIDGQVVSWQADHEFNPPALDELVDVEEKQLALSSAAIETQPVKDSTFQYAKTLSEGFFNAGVVDLPPGSEKRPKNSRKMFMTFFVHTGRVLVTVNETSFRISKGGMWFVPRGNYYSIENDYDQPARIFFSQGCEVAPRPSLEEEEGQD